ncbi:MAG: ATP-binding cassette domain-containing protein [Microthrixaceae bacterium]
MIDELPAAGWRERYGSWRLVVGVAWRASRWRASFALAATMLSFAWPPVWALAIGWIADGIVHNDRATALDGVWIIVGWSTLTGAIGGFSFHVRMVLRELATHQLDLELARLTSGIAGIEHLERPAFADRLEALLAQRIQLAGSFDALVMNVSAAVSIVASLGVLASVDPALLLLPLAGLPSVWTSTRSTRRVEKTRDAMAPQVRLVRRLLDTSVSPIAGKELRVFGVDPHLRDIHARESRIAEAAWVTTSVRNAVEGILTQALFTLGFIGSITVLVFAAADGGTSVGEVVAALTLAASMQSQLRQLVMMASWMRSCAEAARRYAWLVGHAAQAAVLDAPADPAAAPDRLHQGIELHGVSFRYPGTDVDVLRDVDLSIPAGSIVAIVGDNGAGKSTLVKLLARYYEPTSGTITVDDTALDRIPAAEWRTRLSAGFQDHARLELLASEAVGLGHLPDLNDHDAHAAALERAAATDVLAQLPEGLSTQLGKAFADGHELSGGQWQKVALGRAMMRAEPLLLLLDEPTAALDAEAEHELFNRYSAAARRVRERTGAITLLVSHRFSTVRAADLIVVIDRRGIAESGSHDELMALGGSYAELFEMQASSYR